MIANLGAREKRALVSFVQGIDEDNARRVDEGKYARFGGTQVRYDDDGEAHCSGGALNSNDGDLIAYGFTKQDITDCVKHLAAAGFTADRGDVEALLFEARAALDAHGNIVRVRDTVTKRQRQTEARKAAGLCIACGKDAGGKTTCKTCGDRANAYRRAKKQGLSGLRC